MPINISKDTSSVKPKFNFDDVDISSLDPDRIQIGTEQQDCVLIAQTYERGAHASPTEAAVYATLARTIQNNKQFSAATSQSLKSYLKSPEESATETAKQAEAFAEDLDISEQGGTQSPTDHIMESLNIGTQQQSTYGTSFGDRLLGCRDCIPCNLRMMAFLELHPNVDLLGTLENYLSDTIGQLTGIADLLNNFDIYGDFCELLNLLSFMCVSDLQRIISLLMALFMLEVPSLDGLIGLLQALVIPIFAPILMAITSLLDQFSVLVTNPLDCVVDAINMQLEKLSVETPRFALRLGLEEDNPLTNISNGLDQLQQQVSDGIQQIRNKLGFYTDQVKAMLDEMGGGDAAYLQSKLKTLQMTRMISFIVSIIKALSKGHAACSSSGQTPDSQEIDNFFQNFLNPYSPFDMYIDDEGQIHIDERIEGFKDAAEPPHTGETLSKIGNVFQFEGEALVDPSPVLNTQDNTSSQINGQAGGQAGGGGIQAGNISSRGQGSAAAITRDSLFTDSDAARTLLGDSVSSRVNQLATQLLQPASTIIPCKLETQVSDVEKVNNWVSELNKT